jgi:hypothetical protein
MQRRRRSPSLLVAVIVAVNTEIAHRTLIGLSMPLGGPWRLDALATARPDGTLVLPLRMARGVARVL